jgi:hypothetical protein
MKKCIGSIKSVDAKNISDFVTTNLDGIVRAVDYNMRLQNDIDSPGRYADGDMSNSPYDLMDDIKKIM